MLFIHSCKWVDLLARCSRAIELLSLPKVVKKWISILFILNREGKYHQTIKFIDERWYSLYNVLTPNK
jgi:hypothetical protein